MNLLIDMPNRCERLKLAFVFFGYYLQVDINVIRVQTAVFSVLTTDSQKRIQPWLFFTMSKPLPPLAGYPPIHTGE